MLTEGSGTPEESAAPEATEADTAAPAGEIDGATTPVAEADGTSVNPQITDSITQVGEEPASLQADDSVLQAEPEDESAEVVAAS